MPRKSIFSEVKIREGREPVDEIRPGDGVDPREEARQRRKVRRMTRMGQGHGIHKHEQFMSQVQTAMESALQMAATPILNLLCVREVVQQGGSLVVVLTPVDGRDDVDLIEAAKAVDHASPMLRRELAGEITRKNTPNLGFMVLPAGASRVDE